MKLQLSYFSTLLLNSKYIWNLQRPRIRTTAINNTVLEKRKLCSNMEPQSKIAFIENVPKDPVKMFSDLLAAEKAHNPNQTFLLLNLATLDSEFGVLNRTVVYRGLTDGHVTFVTEKNTRKYANIIDNSKVSVTIFMGSFKHDGSESTWQVRIFGEAVELNHKQISDLWSDEPVFARIRSRICECGAPVDYAQLKQAHDKLLEAYKSGQDNLPQTETFTAFKIIPNTWDFYKSEPNCIADRVQFRRNKSEEDCWNIIHVAA